MVFMLTGTKMRIFQEGGAVQREIPEHDLSIKMVYLFPSLSNKLAILRWKISSNSIYKNMKFKKHPTINETAIVCLALSIVGIMFLGLRYKEKTTSESFDIQCSDEIATNWGNEKPFTTFEQYPPEDIFTGATAPLDLNSSFIARRFKTTINEALKNDVNFAGHYVIAEWGFTGIGNELAVVDTNTGKAYPFPYVANMGFEYKKDSNLLIVDPL